MAEDDGKEMIRRQENGIEEKAGSWDRSRKRRERKRALIRQEDEKDSRRWSRKGKDKNRVFGRGVKKKGRERDRQ